MCRVKKGPLKDNNAARGSYLRFWPLEIHRIFSIPGDLDRQARWLGRLVIGPMVQRENVGRCNGNMESTRLDAT